MYSVFIAVTNESILLQFFVIRLARATTFLSFNFFFLFLCFFTLAFSFFLGRFILSFFNFLSFFLFFCFFTLAFFFFLRTFTLSFTFPLILDSFLFHIIFVFIFHF